MSCSCDCQCLSKYPGCVDFASPVAQYTETANPDWAASQSIPNLPNIVPSTPTPNYVVPSAPFYNQFSTNPNYPTKQGGNASEIHRYNHAKTIFTATNLANNNIGAGNAPPGSPYMTFKTSADYIAYKQAISALRYGYRPTVTSGCGIQP
jgi:hypothetical protein